MVTRKKRNEGNPILPMDLGIRKNINTKQLKSNRIKHSSTSISTGNEIAPAKDVRDETDTIHGKNDLDSIAASKTSQNICETLQHENDLLNFTSDENIGTSKPSTISQNLSEREKPQSLSLLSCDYGSSQNAGCC